MASIIDSFRETIGDNKSLVKLAVLAAPVFFAYQLYISSKQDFTFFYMVAYIVGFFLFGFLIKVTNGVLDERDTVLPSLNVLKWSWSAIKGLAAVLPYVLICCMLANYFSSIINIISWLDITLKTIIWLVAVAIIITAFLMFVTREKISDAFNIKLLFEKAGDLITMLIFLVIQLIIINIPTTAFVGYTLFVLFGSGNIFAYYLAIALVFNIAMIGHYLAQLHYEVLGQIDN